jgi:hypothetical protein
MVEDPASNDGVPPVVGVELGAKKKGNDGDEERQIAVAERV